MGSLKISKITFGLSPNLRGESRVCLRQWLCGFGPIRKTIAGFSFGLGRKLIVTCLSPRLRHDNPAMIGTLGVSKCQAKVHQRCPATKLPQLFSKHQKYPWYFHEVQLRCFLATFLKKIAASCDVLQDIESHTFSRRSSHFTFPHQLKGLVASSLNMISLVHESSGCP